MSGDPEAERQDLGKQLEESARLLPVLSALMAEQPGLGPNTGTIGRHAPESSPPWAAEAATAYWGIYWGSRTQADLMRAHLGLPARSWAAGEDGLTLIGNYAPVVPPDVLSAARRAVERWNTAALRIRDLDEAESWAPVPQVPGAQPPACPYCGTLSLRFSRQRGVVRCFMPGCTDSHGHATFGHMEFSSLNGDGILVFRDRQVVAFGAQR